MVPIFWLREPCKLRRFCVIHKFPKKSWLGDFPRSFIEMAEMVLLTFSGMFVQNGGWMWVFQGWKTSSNLQRVASEQRLDGTPDVPGLGPWVVSEISYIYFFYQDLCFNSDEEQGAAFVHCSLIKEYLRISEVFCFLIGMRALSPFHNKILTSKSLESQPHPMPMDAFWNAGFGRAATFIYLSTAWLSMTVMFTLS